MDLSKPGLTSAHFAHFGACRVDLRSRELYRDGIRLRLQNHSFQILTILLEKPGVVVTREELRKKLWTAEEFVDFEQGLNTAMMRLRNTLDDTADDARFIETLPRLGYRFIAPVTFSDGAASDAGEDLHAEPEVEERGAIPRPVDPPMRERPQPTRQGWRRPAVLGVLGAVLLAVLAIGFAVEGWHVTPVSQTTPTVAILPFDSLSNDPAQSFLAEGMTDQLITELGKDRGLRVVSRGSVMKYEGRHVELEEVARDLHADDVFEGSITESGGVLRATGNLYQVATQRHLWAESYQKEAGEGLTAQREIVQAMTKSIEASLKAGR